MTSDVKLSHYFLLLRIKQRRVQKTISKHHQLCECRETSTAEYILHKLFLFQLKRLEVWIIAIWMNIATSIFCGDRVLQLLYHKVQRAHGIRCSQKWLELKFCWFQRLGSNFSWGRYRRCSILVEKPLCQSLFLSSNFIKEETLAQRFSCEFCKIF